MKQQNIENMDKEMDNTLELNKKSVGISKNRHFRFHYSIV